MADYDVFLETFYAYFLKRKVINFCFELAGKLLLVSVLFPRDHNLMSAIKLDYRTSFSLFDFFVEDAQPIAEVALLFKDLDFIVAYFEELLFEVPRTKRAESFP